MSACDSCATFVAECSCPVGDGAAELCWLCAHQVAVHEVAVGDAWRAACGCTPAEIYPAGVIAARAATLPSPEVAASRACVAAMQAARDAAHPAQIADVRRARLTRALTARKGAGVATPRARTIKA